VPTSGRWRGNRDAGVWTDDYCGLGQAAYPDICAAECGNEICSWSWEGAEHLVAGPTFTRDPAYRMRHTRHLGGSNLGFLDGHARWYSAEAIISALAKCEIQGVIPWGPNGQGYGATWASGFAECWPDYVYQLLF